MSYDLQVYARDELTAVGLRALVGQSPGLAVDAAEGPWLAASRGVRRRYSFTVDGPDRLEAEDIPPAVLASVLGARYLYSVNVEGSANSEIPHAVRFARRLAKILDGAVVDQQTGEIWSRSQSRAVPKPAREERIATVDLAWFSLRKDIPDNASAVMVSAAERYLPEALPRRFGEYEPFQHKYSDEGGAGFHQAWRETTSLLFFSGSGPCVGGDLSAGPNAQYPDRYWSMSMTFLATPLHEPGWRDAARHLFIALADGVHAFYASAEVSRNNVWSGRTLWIDSQTEVPIRTMRHRDGWLGLPPTPTWWSWFGAPYQFVESQLPRDGLTATTEGILFESAREPAPLDSLQHLSRWLPASLFASLAPNPDRQRPPPLIRAPEIPLELG